MYRYFVSCSLVLLLAFSADAQNGLQTAGGTTSLLQGPRAGMALSLDVNASRLGFTWNTSRLWAGNTVANEDEPVCPTELNELEKLAEPLVAICSNAVNRLPNESQDACVARRGAESAEYRRVEGIYHQCVFTARGYLYGLSNNLTFALAAQEGKRALFSDNEFTPGAEVHEKFGYSFSNDLIDPGGLVSMFGAADLAVVGRDVAQVTPSTTPGTSETIELDNRTGTTLKVGGGLNWMPMPTAGVVGLSGQWARNWNTPLATQTSQVCVQKTSGTGSDGDPITINDCKNRYVGGIGGANAGVFRVDWVSPRLDLTTGKFYSAKANVHHLTNEDMELFSTGVAGGLIFGSQIAVRDEVKPEYNVAIGPALYKAFQPLAVLTAVMLEFSDLSNSTGQNPDFGDKFSVMLYLGAPF